MRKRVIVCYNDCKHAPVAQLDRAQASDAWCRWFESNRMRHKATTSVVAFFSLRIQTNDKSLVTLAFVLELQLHFFSVLAIPSLRSLRIQSDAPQRTSPLFYPKVNGYFSSSLFHLLSTQHKGKFHSKTDGIFSGYPSEFI